MEIEVLQRIDLSLMMQPYHYSAIREMFGPEFMDESSLEQLYNYMDNYLFFIIVEGRKDSQVLLHCLAASLFYFEAQRHTRGIETTARILKDRFSVGPTFLRKFTRIIDQSVSDLKELGSDSSLIDHIATKIDLHSYLE